MVAEAFDYQPVIKGVAWDRRQNRLLVLLAKGIAGESAALDIVNPALGEVRRVGLVFPSGAEPQSFGQVVAGHDYIWFRNSNGKNPVYRLDREQLRDKGEALTPARSVAVRRSRRTVGTPSLGYQARRVAAHEEGGGARDPPLQGVVTCEPPHSLWQSGARSNTISHSTRSRVV